jgi:hypothetical protein
MRKIMKAKIKALKQELKTLAKLIRKTKFEHKEYQRTDEWSGTERTRRELYKAQYEFRHKHISYCMIRGRTYEQIEPKVREGNEPNKTHLSNLLEQYDPTEVSDEEAVCTSAQ